jgi:hypothetical protein
MNETFLAESRAFLPRAAVLEDIEDLDLEIALSSTTSGIVATLQGGRPGREGPSP